MKKQKTPDPVIQGSNACVETKELRIITQLILSRFKAEKIICFGSIVCNVRNNSCFAHQQLQIHSKGNSYYLLVVPAAHESIGNGMIQQRLEQAINAIANVTIIVHKMDEINTALQNGSSFFSTIYRKGSLLHDNDMEMFAVPAAGADIGKRISKREKFWHQWHLLSENFLKGAYFYQEQQFNNLAVFMLHQSLQHCYSGMLRVLTGYRSNSNSLKRLLKLIENILPEFSFSAVKHTPENARLLSLLMSGFSDARYNDKFEISNTELHILMTRIDNIIKQANLNCQEHLNNLRIGKTPYIA